MECRRQVRAQPVVTTPATSSAEVESDVGRRSADNKEQVTPVFNDKEEPKLEIVVWTT